MALVFNEETAERMPWPYHLEAWRRQGAKHPALGAPYGKRPARPFNEMRETFDVTAIGAYFRTKYRTAARERGHAKVAAQLKKQGVPLDVALRILGIRSRA